MSLSIDIKALVYVLLVWPLMSTPVVIAAGDQLFTAHCSACHSLDSEIPLRVGPQLFGIVGRTAGDIEDYSYSDALREKAGDGLQWDAGTLDTFLAAPADFIPGTIMGFPGMADAEDRATLIDWLATASAKEQRRAAGAAIPATPAVQKILTLNADPEYGEYLAGECLTCHRGNDLDGGVPPINGIPSVYFVQALMDYKNKTRSNAVMQLMAGNLGDEELAALAAFFEEISP